MKKMTYKLLLFFLAFPELIALGVLASARSLNSFALILTILSMAVMLNTNHSYTLQAPGIRSLEYPINEVYRSEQKNKIPLNLIRLF